MKKIQFLKVTMLDFSGEQFCQLDSEKNVTLHADKKTAESSA
ncbi:hypothetical protein [Superficieibacter sp.]|nr:hypothetical protein [Superficieibacter sp.]